MRVRIPSGREAGQTEGMPGPLILILAGTMDHQLANLKRENCTPAGPSQFKASTQFKRADLDL